jgi:predicted HAD superfamily Cof-like phosphohydrolase
MKKVMSFIGCALFVAAMTVACGGNTENTDSTDSLNNAEVVETETPAPADQEATVDNSAREAAIAEAAEKICNCASGDKSKIQECLKSVISTCYAAYQNDKDFTDAVYEKALKCAVEKAANKAIEKGTEKLADEAAKQLNNIKL